MMLCEQCGYKASVCENGKDALEMVRTNAAINLVLSDVMMEGNSGDELNLRRPAPLPHPSLRLP